jgi:hypothetical protein
MLAAKRSILLNGQEIARTPLVVPSFSSKGFPEVDKIIQTLEEAITSCVLVSAYDINYGFVPIPLTFPAFVFLDSGGYECAKDTELSDLGYIDHKPRPWSAEDHTKVLDSWKSETPTIVVSYDHPGMRCSTREQIENARQLFQGRNVVSELLFKPETKGSLRVDIDKVIALIHELRYFDVIGFTEKELGYSLFRRMQNIAKIRRAMSVVGLHKPIHIFGSLDPISTPHYFLAGADIFDGLTWLRFAYLNGQTVYIHNFAAITIGSRINDEMIRPRVWFHNYQQLLDLELSMRRYLKEQHFTCFGYHADLLEKSYRELIASLEED